jgi:azurin
VIRLGTVKEKMLFDKTTLKVTAGKRIKLVFDNNDSMPHNLIIGRPGSLERLGQAADRMLTDPNAVKRGYVPDTPDVIASLGLLFPGQKEVLSFTAPKEPGQYDYVCTFPGHWRLMKGVMTVVGGE